MRFNALFYHTLSFSLFVAQGLAAPAPAGGVLDKRAGSTPGPAAESTPGPLSPENLREHDEKDPAPWRTGPKSQGSSMAGEDGSEAGDGAGAASEHDNKVGDGAGAASEHDNKVDDAKMKAWEERVKEQEREKEEKKKQEKNRKERERKERRERTKQKKEKRFEEGDDLIDVHSDTSSPASSDSESSHGGYESDRVPLLAADPDSE